MNNQTRLLVAIALSLLIVIVHQKLFVEPYAEVQKASIAQQENGQTNRITTVSQIDEHNITQKYIENNGKTITIENNKIKAHISTATGSITQITLKDFNEIKQGSNTTLFDEEALASTHQGTAHMENLLSEQTSLLGWNVIKQEADSITLEHKTKDNILLTKKIKCHNSSYGIELEFLFHNINTSTTPIKYKIIFANSAKINNPIDQRYMGADIKINDEIKRYTPGKIKKIGSESFAETPQWMSMRGRYFSIIAEPKDKIGSAFIEKSNENGIKTGMVVGTTNMASRETLSKGFVLYAGPNKQKEIEKVSTNMNGVITYGMFGGISGVLLKALDFLKNILGNYGIAIIILTMLINLMLFPLTRKSLKSMKDMQALQPKIEQLREEYKNNPQKLNKEIMELYKTHKVNPLGGCLPFLLQMPIFIALYQLLIRAVQLKGAQFLWIKDLSEPDALFKISSNLPVVGNSINILPILIVIAMFFQQKFSQANTKQTEQQKMFAFIIPGVLGVVTYNLPSGFLLYWLTSTTVMLLTQIFIAKKS